MTTTTTWTSPRTEPYPCDRGFGDGVGRGYHNYVSQGIYWGYPCCSYCGQIPLPLRRSFTVTSGRSIMAYKGETYVLNEVE